MTEETPGIAVVRQQRSQAAPSEATMPEAESGEDRLWHLCPKRILLGNGCCSCGAARPIKCCEQLFHGSAGFLALGVFLVVTHAECHLTGPSVILGVLLASICSIISGFFLSELHSQSPSTKSVFEGRLARFVTGWLEVVSLMSLIAVTSRCFSATVDKTSDNRFHQFVLAHFGKAPFLETFPDFAAGGAAMVPALLVAAGFERSRCLEKLIGGLTLFGFGSVLLLGAADAKTEVFKSQRAFLDGSKGVFLSAGVISALLSSMSGQSWSGRGQTSVSQDLSDVETGRHVSEGAQGSAGLTQTVGATMFMAVALVVPFMVELSPLGLVPEVPLLQAFEDDYGKGWTRMFIAAVIIVTMGLTLLHLTVPLHQKLHEMSSSGLIYSCLGGNGSLTRLLADQLGIKFSLGSVFIGAATAVLATLADLPELLLVSASSHLLLDFFILAYALLVRYGLREVDFRGERIGGKRRILVKRLRHRTRKEQRRKQKAYIRSKIRRDADQDRQRSLTQYLSGADNSQPFQPLDDQASSGEQLPQQQEPQQQQQAGNSNAFVARLNNGLIRLVTESRYRLGLFQGKCENDAACPAQKSVLSLAMRRLQNAGGRLPRSRLEEEHDEDEDVSTTSTLSCSSPLSSSSSSSCTSSDEGSEDEDDQPKVADFSHEPHTPHSDYGTDTSQGGSSQPVSQTHTNDDLDELDGVAVIPGDDESDIEAYVERYRADHAATVATIPVSAHADSKQLYRRSGSKPNLATFQRTCLALCLILSCFGLQKFVFIQVRKNHMEVTTSPEVAGNDGFGGPVHTDVSTLPNLIVFNLILSMLIFPLLIFVSKQPTAERRTEFGGFRLPKAVWLASITVFVQINVYAALLEVAWVENIIVLSLGVFVFLTYGRFTFLPGGDVDCLDDARYLPNRTGSVGQPEAGGNILRDSLLNRPAPELPLGVLPNVMWEAEDARLRRRHEKDAGSAGSNAAEDDDEQC